MPAVVTVARELVESIADIQFPPVVNARMQQLMDRNSDGLLTADERAELESLVDWGERLSIMQMQAMAVLGRRPTSSAAGSEPRSGGSS